VSDTQPLGLLVGAARPCLRHAICARARRFRLTTQQFWAMVVLRQNADLTPGDLASGLLLDAPAASRLVALLVRRKLLEVRPDREDRRRTRLFLSEAGVALAEQLAPIEAEFQATLVRGMSDEELAVMRAGLRRIVANLAAFESSRRARAGDDD
jgi:DNA-binding MarR family transcriptional regulator